MRDYFTLDVTTGDGTKPQITVSFDGPSEQFMEQLGGENGTGTALESDRLDVSYRMHDDSMAPGTSGVLAVTDRVTGDFILECNADAGTIDRLVTAAREHDDSTSDGQYQFTLTVNGHDAIACDRDLFLVYSTEGELLRQHSLIPSGVEL